MSRPIEDYALIGDTRTAALVGIDGSIDWLCVPRFDAPACFAALLGDPENGHWRLAPVGSERATKRRYRDATMVLESDFETASGDVSVIDFMPLPHDDGQVDIIRIVVGRRGTVTMQTDFVLRLDYGSIVPWVRRRDHGLIAVAGPDAVRFDSPVALENRDFRSTARFDVEKGQTLAFRFTAYPSHRAGPIVCDPEEDLEACEMWWRDWTAGCSYEGPWREAVLRSLLTLKALTYAPTGGIVAAVTTSLPEALGGARNWDYRYCWLRDATLTLNALASSGFLSEARAWREWLLRAVAGDPAKLQIMYSVTGERRLAESELSWLSGYEGSRPVRIGNAAHGQIQLDVIGELIDSLHVDRVHHLKPSDKAWNVQSVLLDALATTWHEPDSGIWEVRGPRRHFTHSKVMAWVAFDRAVKAVESFDRPGPVAQWRTLRDRIHQDVCANAYDPDLETFVQHYGGKRLDASLLLMPIVGFLPATDDRIIRTVEAIRRDLMVGGLVRRYATDPDVDGLDGTENPFLACSFWLADALCLMGRRNEAALLFERLLSLCNDVGLLAEQYDPQAKRQLGNFPQAFSHIGIVTTAQHLGSPNG